MFRVKHASDLLKAHFRRLHAQASYSTTSGVSVRRSYPGALVVSSSVLAAYILWYSNTRVVHNDAASPVAASKPKQEPLTLLPGGAVGDSEDLHTVVWGSNRCSSLFLASNPCPTMSRTGLIRLSRMGLWKPSAPSPLQSGWMALRYGIWLFIVTMPLASMPVEMCINGEAGFRIQNQGNMLVQH